MPHTYTQLLHTVYPPHTNFFSYLMATFPFLGLYLSQMVHLIPYPMRSGPTRW